MVTAGANEGICCMRSSLTIGMISAFAAFLDDGDEVLVMEPYFDQVCPLLS